jgi:mannan endo-1,4-beta-mannosidase
MKRLSGVLALGLVLLSGCSYSKQSSSVFPSAPHPSLTVGVYEQKVPESWSMLSNFTSVTGVSPKIVVYFSGWHERFWTSFATTAHQHGATVFVKMLPSTETLAEIASGDSDAYLRTYAQAVRSFKAPVIISFAQEMNGTWYPWGVGHATPAQFVAAWRHVVSVFRAEGANNVIWVWTINSTNVAEGGLTRWWPGARWVSWVGIDGYFGSTTDSYMSLFGDTINQVRAFTRKPIFIAETAVGTIPDREHRIDSLFAGARLDHVIGLIWFDVGPHQGDHGYDWRLEGDPAAVAAFKAAAQG